MEPGGWRVTQRGNEVGDNHHGSFREQHMDMQPIENARALTATLTQDQWNVVLGHLDAGQHRVVRPIIDSLVAQLQQQSQPRFSMEDADNA